MERTRWQRLSNALDALLDLDGDARIARLAEIETEDADFARDLRNLLAQEHTEDTLLDSPLVTAPPGPREGEQVGPYRLETLLGEGGMGQVWVAERADGLYERRVALKLLRPGLADPNLRLRFTRERQILARLAHPHIARLLDAGISASGQPYLALEEVQGEGILEYCRKRDLGLRPRLQLFQQVCEAVTHAHANLVVHRDLKPSNILVTPDGQVRLLDFGIAKLLDGNEADPPEQTRTGVRSFTLHYAAPEQIRGEPVTTQTDVYSLGVVMYELLTGSKPYRLKRETSAQWEEAILAGDPQRPSNAVVRGGEDEAVPGIDRKRWSKMLVGDLDNIALKALSKLPSERYPSAEALSLDIQRHLDGLPVLARAPSFGYRTRKFLSRHRWPIALTLLIGLTLVGLLGFTWWQRQQAIRETARAQALQTFVVGLFENAGVARTGKPLDVETLIDAGELRGDRELALQPRAHAELLGVIARIRIALGQYEEARILLQRQQDLLMSLTDAPPGLRLEAATQRGRVQRLQGDVHGCIATLASVEPRAARAQAQLPALVADYYSQLARCRRALGERDAARSLFERSLALRRSALGDDIGVVENLTDLAALSVDAGDSPQALRGFEGALAQLRKIAGPRHPLAIDILRSIGATQQQMGQAVAASRSWGEALMLSDDLQGPSHPATLSLRRQHALLLLETGRLREAEASLEANRPLIQQRYGATSVEAAAAWDALGQVSHELGELDQSHDQFLRAARILRDAKSQAALADTLQRDAAVLIEAHRAQSALRVLEDIRKLRGQPNIEWLQLQAAARLQLGDVTQALEELGIARRIAPDSLELRSLQSHLLLADATSDAASRANAMSTLEEATTLTPTNRTSPQRLRAQLWLAQALCTTSPERAQSLFDDLQSTLAEAQPQGGVLSRQTKAAHDACPSPTATTPITAPTASTPAQASPITRPRGAAAAGAQSRPRRASLS